MDHTPAKIAFASRLRELCTEMGLPEHGRQSALARQFGVSQQAAKKWLDGDGFPVLETAVAIADWAGVNVTWLLQGEGPKYLAKIDMRSILLSEAIENLPQESKISVIDFIHYKIEKSPTIFTSEKLGTYVKMLDSFKETRKKEKEK